VKLHAASCGQRLVELAANRFRRLVLRRHDGLGEGVTPICATTTPIIAKRSFIGPSPGGNLSRPFAFAKRCRAQTAPNGPDMRVPRRWCSFAQLRFLAVKALLTMSEP
jgi:hypothetical protein